MTTTLPVFPTLPFDACRWLNFPKGVFPFTTRTEFYFKFAQDSEIDVAAGRLAKVIHFLALFNSVGPSASLTALPTLEWVQIVKKDLKGEIGVLYLKAADAAVTEIPLFEEAAQSHDLRVKRVAGAALERLRPIAEEAGRHAARLSSSSLVC